MSTISLVNDALRDSHVLLVDDNIVNLNLLRVLLTNEGYRHIEQISDPRDIRTVFPANDFDLVILDVQMPHLDGFEVMRAIRAMEAENEEDQRIPILILTAQSDRAIKLRALEEGAFDFVTKPVDTNEVACRIRNALTQRILLRRLRHKFEASDHMRQLKEEEVRQAAADLVAAAAARSDLEHQVHDLMTSHPVTRLPNRYAFAGQLQRTIEHGQPGVDVGLMLIDLDQFRLVNEAQGHGAGDQLLRTVAKRIEPFAAAGSLGHLGADEYGIIFSTKNGEEVAANLAQRIMTTLADPVELDGGSVPLTASLGIAFYPNDGKDADDLIRCADIAVYRAKDDGRNCFRYFHADMNSRIQDRQSLTTRLRAALANQELHLHYQPQIDLATGKVTGAEALMRWKDPLEGWISPGRFIPVAESSGLIIPMGEWCLHEACRQNRQWQDQGLPPIKVAVNLSAVEFEQTDLIERVHSTLRDTTLSSAHLELEITESIAMGHAAATLEALRGLRDLGVELSIDDFGTGYSSLAYLRSYPVHKIKIDQAFVKEVEPDGDGGTIADAVIRLSHALGKKVIAEGVETEFQRDFINQRHCDEAQGYLFARPLPAAEFAEYLRQNARSPT